MSAHAVTGQLTGGGHPVAEKVSEVQVKGLHQVPIRNSDVGPRQALLEAKYRQAG
jgi:hypothetical protein